MSLHFSFLVLEEHPYGREMLRILLENDLVPSMIIQEVSKVSDEERKKFLERMAGQPVPPRLTQLSQGRKYRYIVYPIIMTIPAKNCSQPINLTY